MQGDNHITLDIDGIESVVGRTLRPSQRILFESIRAHPRVVAACHRQMGTSTLLAAIVHKYLSEGRKVAYIGGPNSIKKFMFKVLKGVGLDEDRAFPDLVCSDKNDRFLMLEALQGRIFDLMVIDNAHWCVGWDDAVTGVCVELLSCLRPDARLVVASAIGYDRSGFTDMFLRRNLPGVVDYPRLPWYIDHDEVWAAAGQKIYGERSFDINYGVNFSQNHAVL